MFLKVKILPQKSNLGFAKAINVAAKKAEGYFLFITNNDVTFTPDFFDKLITFANSDPKIGVCGGKITTTMANIKYLDGAANISKLTSRLKKLKNYQKVQEVDWISGSGLLIKRKVFSLLNEFDTNFPFYFEDLDLCLRVKNLGLKVIYYPKAIMYHQQSSTAGKMPKKWQNDVWYEGKVYLIKKHFPYWSKPIAILSQTFFCLYILIAKRQNRFNSFLPALRKVSRYKPQGPQVIKRARITKKQILAYYSQGEVFTARNSAPFQQVILKDFYQLLTTNYPTKRWHILEFGVGHGWNLPQMVKYFGKITGVDIAPAAISESKEYKFRKVDLKLIKEEKLPFADNTFDLIVACEVLEHVPDLEFTVKELKRVTKFNGYILVSVPVYWNLRGISKKIMESKLGEGTWEPARSHPGGFERFLTPKTIRDYFKDCQIIETRGADYGNAWSLPSIPLYPKSWTPFFEVTLGKIPFIKKFGLNFYLLAQKE